MVEPTHSRPRIEGEREQEILDAVVEALLDVGYDKLTFDLVATHAKASKATLYRKWSGKPELVMAAVVNSRSCHLTDAPLPDTGTLEGDLLELAGRKDVRDSRDSDVVSAVGSALTRDAALREQFVAHFAQPRIDRFAELLQRAQARGEIAETVDVSLLVHVMPAMAIHHTLVLGGPPTAEYFTQVIQEVLLPAAGLTTSKGGAHVNHR